jgi:hypothetical protein
VAIPNTFDLTDGCGTVFLMEPDAVNDRPVALQLGGEVVNTPVSGVRYTAKDGSLPSAIWTFDFTTITRADLQALKDFVDAQTAMAGARQTDGTSRGFWFPTWQWDLEVVDTDGLSFVSFVRRGLADEIFPLGEHFRRFVLVSGANYTEFHALSASVSGGLDRLVVSPQNGSGSITAPLPWTRAHGVRPLWLRYGRFDSDDFAYRHIDGGDAFSATLTIHELPDEAPIPE